MPRSAAALRDSVGINTHSVYFDTAYADWPRVVAALRRLGVQHVRDGIFANPAPRWRAWNARYVAAIEEAARQGIRFDFIVGRPFNPTGTIPELVRLAATRLRGAVDSLEGPNEWDLSQQADWPDQLATYQHRLYATVRADRRLAGVPVVGPSFGANDVAEGGDLSSWMDFGNFHPYTGGQPPGPALLGRQIAAAMSVSGSRPLYATEVGFTDAMNARTGQSPVPEDVAAVYDLRTLLEHFLAGIRRTYFYELLDEKPDPGGTDPEEHFGLLHHDFRPKPAYTTLADLMAVLGGGPGPPRLTSLDYRLTTVQPSPGGTSGLRSLLLQRTDSRYLLFLWTDGSLWDALTRRRPPPRGLRVRLELARPALVSLYRLTAGIGGQAMGRRRSVEIGVGPDPILLVLAPG